MHTAEYSSLIVLQRYDEIQGSYFKVKQDKFKVEKESTYF